MWKCIILSYVQMCMPVAGINTTAFPHQLNTEGMYSTCIIICTSYTSKFMFTVYISVGWIKTEAKEFLIYIITIIVRLN